MKIVATISDIASTVYCGGAVEKVSAIIEIPDENIPRIVFEEIQ